MLWNWPDFGPPPNAELEDVSSQSLNLLLVPSLKVMALASLKVWWFGHLLVLFVDLGLHLVFHERGVHCISDHRSLHLHLLSHFFISKYDMEEVREHLLILLNQIFWGEHRNEFNPVKIFDLMFLIGFNYLIVDLNLTKRCQKEILAFFGDKTVVFRDIYSIIRKWHFGFYFVLILNYF